MENKIGRPIKKDNELLDVVFFSKNYIYCFWFAIKYLLKCLCGDLNNVYWSSSLLSFESLNSLLQCFWSLDVGVISYTSSSVS